MEDCQQSFIRVTRTCRHLSRIGLSTKIRATVDALGNPTTFYLAGGQATDLDVAYFLLPDLAAPKSVADKGYDAEARVLAPLAQAGK